MRFVCQNLAGEDGADIGSDREAATCVQRKRFSMWENADPKRLSTQSFSPQKMAGSQN